MPLNNIIAVQRNFSASLRQPRRCLHVLYIVPTGEIAHFLWQWQTAGIAADSSYLEFQKYAIACYCNILKASYCLLLAVLSRHDRPWRCARRPWVFPTPLARKLSCTSQRHTVPDWRCFALSTNTSKALAVGLFSRLDLRPNMSDSFCHDMSRPIRPKDSQSLSFSSRPSSGTACVTTKIILQYISIVSWRSPGTNSDASTAAATGAASLASLSPLWAGPEEATRPLQRVCDSFLLDAESMPKIL